MKKNQVQAEGGGAAAAAIPSVNKAAAVREVLMRILFAGPAGGFIVGGRGWGVCRLPARKKTTPPRGSTPTRRPSGSGAWI